MSEITDAVPNIGQPGNHARARMTAQVGSVRGPAGEVPTSRGGRYRASPMTKRSTIARAQAKGKAGKTGPRSTGRLQRAIDDTVAREIRAALKEADGVITDAARLLGISRIALRARMNALDIRG